MLARILEEGYEISVCPGGFEVTYKVLASHASRLYSWGCEKISAAKLVLPSIFWEGLPAHLEPSLYIHTSWSLILSSSQLANIHFFIMESTFAVASHTNHLPSTRGVLSYQLHSGTYGPFPHDGSLLTSNLRTSPLVLRPRRPSVTLCPIPAFYATFVDLADNAPAKSGSLWTNVPHRIPNLPLEVTANPQPIDRTTCRAHLPRGVFWGSSAVRPTGKNRLQRRVRYQMPTYNATIVELLVSVDSTRRRLDARSVIVGLPCIGFHRETIHMRDRHQP
jgi:hypothetical protein